MAASAKHRLGFREKLGLYALTLLLIGAALLGYLWFALDRYESNTPESSVRPVPPGNGCRTVGDHSPGR